MLSDGIEALAEALTQIVRTSTEEANRRAYTRHPCSVLTELAGSFGAAEAELLDVSRGGALIQTEVPLGLGDHLVLQFPERDTPQHGHVVGVSRHGIHVQFAPPPLADQDVARWRRIAERCPALCLSRPPADRRRRSLKSSGRTGQSPLGAPLSLHGKWH